jgi:exodeoxyribonuclease-3
MRIASWNLNGIRACSKSGLGDWLKKGRWDAVLFQEVRADPEQIPLEIQNLPGYVKLWAPSIVKKGYSGTGILLRQEPLKTYVGMGQAEFDGEGRVLSAETKQAVLVSAYFPNSQDGGKRLEFKLRFCDAIWEFTEKLRKKTGKPLVLGGDFNIAHEPIDLARPKDNDESPGYLPEERAWMTKYLNGDWADTYRSLHPDTVRYSWWSARTRARERDIGWRIDYHTVHKRDLDLVKKAEIHTEVLGSDHCPVSLELALDKA